MSLNSWQKRLDAAIPGGAHTYSKGRDAFPSNAPEILVRGKGSYLWTPERKKYLDFGMGLKSVVLGYSDSYVNKHVKNALQTGNNLSRPSIYELYAAEELAQLVQGSVMVKFAKNGSNVTTAALKIARAATNRKIIAVPLQQPFFSFDDWFIGTTPVKSGIPEEHSMLTKRFLYGEIQSLRNLFQDFSGEVAAVLMEPAVDLLPCMHGFCSRPECLQTKMTLTREYLQEVRRLCSENGTVLIFDEMRTGFRWALGGAQSLFDVQPDLSTFGKAIANGFSLSALVGKQELMSLGSTDTKGTRRTFLLSSTHGAEITSLEAFRATLRKMQKHNVVDYLWAFGGDLEREIRVAFSDSYWSKFIQLTGPPVALEIQFLSGENWTSEQLKTKFYTLLMDQGILMPTISQSWSHGCKELKKLSTAFDILLTKLTKNKNDSGYFQEQIHTLSPVFREFN